MGRLETVGDPLAAFLVLGATICVLAAVYLVGGGPPRAARRMK